MMRAKSIGALVAFPIALVHELAHYFAALPWADDAMLMLEPAGGRATTFIDFDDSAPRWAVALACVFPTVAGVVVGAGALVWWALEGLATPADLEGWLRLAVASLSWGVFSWPSREDIDGARNGPEKHGSEDATPGVEA